MKYTDLSPKTVLAVAAHPDDIEFCFGGTIAAWTAAGTKVHYLILTDGANGTSDRSISQSQLRETRQKEQANAATILSVTNVTHLTYPDGALENTLNLKRDVVKAIRMAKPEVVLAMDPTMIYDVDLGLINHPDHRAAGQAVLDAVYPLARNHLAFPELAAEGFEPHKVQTVLLANYTKATYYSDITGTFEQKMQALAAHTSQISDIATVRPSVEAMATQAGQAAGCKLAEGFVRIDVQVW